MLSRMFRASCFIYILSVFSPFVFCFSPFSLQAGEAKSASGSALAVRNAPVRLVEEGTVIRVPGTVEAVEHSTISARISAVIVAVPIKLGDRVGKGQVLVRLQADELNARASQAVLTANISAVVAKLAILLCTRSAQTRIKARPSPVSTVRTLTMSGISIRNG